MRSRHPERAGIRLGDLKGRALRIAPGQAVAYVTDAAPHGENRAKILRSPTRPISSSSKRCFWNATAPSRWPSHHLTAWEAGALAREAGVRHVTPFHHSARYLSEPDALRDEALCELRIGRPESDLRLDLIPQLKTACWICRGSGLRPELKRTTR